MACVRFICSVVLLLKVAQEVLGATQLWCRTRQIELPLPFFLIDEDGVFATQKCKPLGLIVWIVCWC